MKKVKATENKAKSVETSEEIVEIDEDGNVHKAGVGTKPDNMCRVQPGLIDAVISYMANSICRTMTLQESSNIVQALTESKNKA